MSSLREFIPSFHLDFTKDQKLTDEWFKEATQHTYNHGGSTSLTFGKNITEIERFAEGDIPMEPYHKMFGKPEEDRDDGMQRIRSQFDDETSPISYEPLPLLPVKIRSAHSTMDKIPFEFEVRANDATAFKKIESDISFLKNKPQAQAELSNITQKLGLGEVDLGTTKYSDVPYSNAPYGLDLADPEDEASFKMVYSLAVETAFESALKGCVDMTGFDDLKSLLIKDQIYLGVSTSRSHIDAITGLPNYIYTHPSKFQVPFSYFKNYKDNPFRFIDEDELTVMELFSRFGNEIGSKEDLNRIINDPECGYCVKNKKNSLPFDNFKTAKVFLVKCEIKSVDCVGVKKINEKSKYRKLVEGKEALECKDQIWGQNTYCGYWLKNTPYFFDKKILEYCYREKGREAKQGFSSIIYRSSKLSTVELGIGENKKAQIAALKIQELIIKALPPGVYIDIKYLLKSFIALSKAQGEGGTKYTVDYLLKMALLENKMIGDSSDMDGKNEGQFRPFERIPGGVRDELNGYFQVILDSEAKISRYTGINEQLTGQSANPQGLIGMQKLLINSSINALYHIHKAIEVQSQEMMTIWASGIVEAIRAGGKRKEAIVRMIGSRKAELLKDLDDLPIHNFSLEVNILQREEERQRFETEMERLKQQGVTNVVDDYILSALSNPKEKRLHLAVRFKNWQKKQDAVRAEQNEQQQVLMKQAGDNKQAEISGKLQADVTKIQAQGEVSKDVLTLAAQLGISDDQMKSANKKDLQQDRGDYQYNKAIDTLKTKADLENQKAVTVL